MDPEEDLPYYQGIDFSDEIILRSIDDFDKEITENSIIYTFIEDKLYSLLEETTIDKEKNKFVFADISEYDILYSTNKELFQGQYFITSSFSDRSSNIVNRFKSYIENNVGDFHKVFTQSFLTIYEALNLFLDASRATQDISGRVMLSYLLEKIQNLPEGNIKLRSSNYFTKYPGLARITSDSKIEVVFHYKVPLELVPFSATVMLLLNLVVWK